MIAVGARCTDVRSNELLVVRGCCVPYVRGIVLALLYSTSHVCLHLVAMDRLDQQCRSLLDVVQSLILVGGNHFGTCGVRGRIIHELEIV